MKAFSNKLDFHNNICYICDEVYMTMDNLKRYGTVPLRTHVLEESMPEYASPKDKISALEREGALIRLRNGLYVVSKKVTEQNISLELIANHLQGPSYVSFESALSFHGLIPERVYLVRSASIKRARTYSTPLGNFEYVKIPENYYPIGIESVLVNNSYAFLMARPEKAICDLITTTAGLRIQSLKAMREYLEQDMRMDTDLMEKWDLSIIEDCISTGYKKNDLRFLLKYLQHG